MLNVVVKFSLNTFLYDTFDGPMTRKKKITQYEDNDSTRKRLEMMRKTTTTRHCLKDTKEELYE